MGQEILSAFEGGCQTRLFFSFVKATIKPPLQGNSRDYAHHIDLPPTALFPARNYKQKGNVLTKLLTRLHRTFTRKNRQHDQQPFCQHMDAEAHPPPTALFLVIYYRMSLEAHTPTVVLHISLCPLLCISA